MMLQNGLQKCVIFISASHINGNSLDAVLYCFICFAG